MTLILSHSFMHLSCKLPSPFGSPQPSILNYFPLSPSRSKLWIINYDFIISLTVSPPNVQALPHPSRHADIPPILQTSFRILFYFTHKPLQEIQAYRLSLCITAVYCQFSLHVLCPRTITRWMPDKWRKWELTARNSPTGLRDVMDGFMDGYGKLSRIQH